MEKKEVVVLDTNVLLDDPNAIRAFPGKYVLIPIVCIEEIDKFKKDLNGVGRNAREASRQLDALRKMGSLASGVQLENGAVVMIVTGQRPYKYFSALTNDPAHMNDNYILGVAAEANANPDNGEVVLVSKDTNLRLKADALGIKAEDYRPDVKVHIDELYTGLIEVPSDRETIDKLYSSGELVLELDEALYPNQYVLLKDKEDEQHVGLGKFDPEVHAIVPVKPVLDVWGIIPRNIRQKIAFDLLLDDRIPLVTLVGKAGTGKTLLALAAGLQSTVDMKKYSKLLVSRPIFPMGRDVGFLPGELEDKLRPWMQPIFDNLEFIMSGGKKDEDGHGSSSKGHGSYHDLMRLDLLVVEALTYIRGRSIPKQYFIVDEAQNLTPHEIKTIITRAGEGTKIVLTGDPYQIDNPYLDSSSNGLAYVTEHMKGSSLAGHITLIKGERSPLAVAAAELL